MRVPVILVGLLFGYVAGELVDLTHYVDEKAQTHPINRRFKYTNVFRGWWPDNPNIWLENEDFDQPSHLGTHMDAPSHFLKDAWTIDQIPPERLISPLVVIDHSKRCEKDHNDALQIADILRWEEEYGRIPNGAMILAKSGWSKFYTNDTKYFGNADPFKNWKTEGLNYPGFAGDTAEWLVKHRNIYGVGTETISIDIGPSMTFPAHLAFVGANVIMVENVGTGIHKCPPNGAIVLSLPLKNKGASGAPIRMLAYWGEDVARFRNVIGGAGRATCFLSTVLVMLTSIAFML